MLDPRRREIIDLMKQRAKCTARSKSQAFSALTKRINTVQRKLDHDAKKKVVHT